MRFRRRSGFRRPREQTFWLRPAANSCHLTTAAPAASFASASFGGDALDSGLDDRLTMLRLHADLTFQFATVNDADLHIRLAAVYSQVGAPGPNPSMAATTDRQADWLGFKVVPVAIKTPGAIDIGALDADFFHWDIKAKRKANQRQVVSFIAQLVRGGLGALTAGNDVTVSIYTSALFQRTRR